MIADRVTDLLDLFGVEYIIHDERIVTSCPIHGGDNPQAFTIDIDDGPFYGNWRCWTRGCERKYYPTPLGLVRGLLVFHRDERTTFQDAVDFSYEFLKLDDSSILKHKEKFKKSVDRRNSERKPTRHIPKSGISRKQVRSLLDIPSKYYIDRGYKEETLDRFDVGLCKDQRKQMRNRVVVPVYDDTYSYMVGCVGRKTTNNETHSKWINSKSFHSGSYLYGYWISKSYIRDLKTIILVEGQGDVWRLYESGIKNSVGMFGCSLSDSQLFILESSGALNVVVLSDSDEAGEKAKQSIKNKCERMFKLHFPDIPTKDVGDMPIDSIREILVPQLKGMI
tara:strand:+ start:15350 stop:16357 length:1008 start_codon:yes stop_codon:yes gene_type:complete